MAAAVTPALPIQPPGWADFQRCDIRYGIGIQPADCQMAGSFLPQGAHQMLYHTVPGISSEEFTLPWSKTIGTCTVMVEVSGPIPFDITSVQLVPDLIRGMAGYVINQCPGGGDETSTYTFLRAGLGGYVTSGMDRLYHWLERSGDFLSPQNAFTDHWQEKWPNRDTNFVTVTVQRNTQKSKDAGNTDIGVAEKVLQFVRELWDAEQSEIHKHFFWILSKRLEAKVQEMTGREDMHWFDPVSSSRKMEYTCDSKLEGPAVVDCAKLEYHGLGQGTVDFQKGETKYFNQDTCALAVSANKPMRLGWDQINTAFNTLYNLCIDHPLHSAPKGGHATFSANPKELLGRKRRKAKRGDIVTGTNALPQGARIDLWRHGGNGANVACEFRAVLRGESLDKCASS